MLMHEHPPSLGPGLTIHQKDDKKRVTCTRFFSFNSSLIKKPGFWDTGEDRFRIGQRL